VRQFRAERKWSQMQLAKECQLVGWDIGRDTIAQIEARNRWVGDMELRTLARVLGVEIGALVPP